MGFGVWEAARRVQKRNAISYMNADAAHEFNKYSKLDSSLIALFGASAKPESHFNGCTRSPVCLCHFVCTITTCQPFCVLYTHIYAFSFIQNIDYIYALENTLPASKRRVKWNICIEWAPEPAACVGGAASSQTGSKTTKTMAPGADDASWPGFI